MTKDILVVAAHPDDEVIGCGATIAGLAKAGHKVNIAILGEGITSRFPQRSEADQSLIEVLHARSRLVAKQLGAKDVFLFNLPDNRFDTVALLDIVKIIEGLIDKLKPQAVYTHHRGDLNIDHVITHRAVITATRPVIDCPVKEIYAFEVASSTEWAFDRVAGFLPNVFIDATDTLDTKIKALKLYESETRSFPHPRSPEALLATAAKRGSTVGLAAAEAFELIRLVV